MSEMDDLSATVDRFRAAREATERAEQEARRQAEAAREANRERGHADGYRWARDAAESLDQVALVMDDRRPVNHLATDLVAEAASAAGVAGVRAAGAVSATRVDSAEYREGFQAGARTLHDAVSALL